MKRLLMLLFAAILPVSAASITMTARFGEQDLLLVKDGGFDMVDLRAGVPLVRPGAPRLPRIVQSVVIPAGAEPTGVMLTAEEWVTLPGTYRLPPSQPDVPLPKPGWTPEMPNYPPDPAIYERDAAYPEAKIRLLGSGTMSGYRIAKVELYPLRWNPATGELQLAKRLGYRLDYADGFGGATVPTAGQQSAFGEMLRLLVANPQDVKRFAPRVGGQGPATVLPPGNYEYVVITEAPMDTVFQRLADWKTLRGVPGTVVKVSWINANYTGYDLQEKIRNFNKDAWQTWGTMYVLLGGQGDYNSSGQNIVPTRMGNYGGNGNEPCDLYYAGLDGSWDANHNHVYGEVPDSTDMYSDVFVGRAPVYNVAMAQNFVRKVMKYEQDPPAGFTKKMLLPTAILWSSYEERPMQESIARMTPAGWVDGRLYERTGTLSRQAVVDSMNAGVGMGQWSGHGNESGIYMGGTPFFSSSDADAMTNGDKTGMVISIACDCAAWDWVTNGDCLAEHMVNRVGGGCIATIMNTRYGYGAIGRGGGYVVGPSERLDTTFFAGVFEHGRYHTGEALAYAKACWEPYADSLYEFDMQRYCIYDLNLIGDPETPLWTDEPRGLDVAHAGVMTIGNNVPYSVTVSTSGFAPVESAYVLLRKGTEVNVGGRTNSSGQVTLLVSAPTPGPMLMTVSARDCYLYVDTVQVISTARYVAYLRSNVLDPGPGGNNDSILNPGESVRLRTWVKNWGQQSASSVTARLRTHDPNATITDSVKSFGTIAAGDSSCTGDGFGLSVNSGLANGYAVACSLICRDALDSTWVSNVTYYVGTPVLVKRLVTVRDSVRGNGNGRVDPGEASDLQVRIGNTGLGHGYSVQALLRSGDSRFQILDSTASYGLIRKGDSASNPGDLFAVHADAGMPLETPVCCTLRLSAEGGYACTQTFTVVVGEIRAIDPIPDGPRRPSRYYAYDDGDLGYEPHPTYSWVEINAVGTRLAYTQNDAVIAVTLPTGFGPFKFYSGRYTQLSISADGWICPGNYTTGDYSNTGLPDPSTPPGMVCANWDDLYPVSGGGGAGNVYYYHDQSNHRFVVEYDSVRYYSGSVRDKFEMLFYDTTVATYTGENLVVVQYMTANGYNSSTLGIEDPARTIAIQALFDGNYHRGCAPVAAQRAIAYTTDPPNPTGIEERDIMALRLGRAELAAYPNPLRGSGTVVWNVGTEGTVSLRVYDAAGREVRTLVNSRMKPDRYSAVWDGKSNSGRTVSAGIYFYRLETATGSHEQKVVLTSR